MSTFASLYGYNKEAAANGTWVSIGEAKVKIRAFDSEHTTALKSKLEAPFKHLTKAGKDIPVKEYEKIMIKVVANSSLLDWDFKEADGAKVPFSAELAEQWLSDSPLFLRDVSRVLTSDETFRAADREEDLKN
ncbi:MAG: hypothetical protein ACEQSL_05910 [Sediminibacterium sp.]